MELKRDLDSLLNPKSICIVGATEKSIFVQKTVHNLEFQGFNGQLYMVNPKYESVFGYTAYPSILDVPGEIDNALFLIPGKAALEAVKQCVRKRVKSITIITSGFAENGRIEGGKLQEQIREIAVENNILVCGPNCFGTISAHGQVANFCEKIPNKLGKGNIGIVMQSGGLIASTVNLSQIRGIDFSYFVSSGNEAVLESSDYMRFMLDDPNIDVICAFIEGIRDKLKFVKMADLAIERKKPIILIKIGSSDSGREAAVRHTGADSGSDPEFQVMCKEKGITRVDDLEDLIETAAFFAKVLKKGLSLGRRICVLAVSGGGAGLISDIACEIGFEFPKLSEKVSKRLSEIVPEFGSVSNPLDLTAQVFATPGTYIECVEHLLREKDLDVLAFAWALGIPREPGAVSTVLEGLSKITKETDKLCMLFSLVNMGLNDWGKELLQKCDMPFIQGTRRTFKAIKALIAYNEIVRRKTS